MSTDRLSSGWSICLLFCCFEGSVPWRFHRCGESGRWASDTCSLILRVRTPTETSVRSRRGRTYNQLTCGRASQPATDRMRLSPFLHDHIPAPVRSRTVSGIEPEVVLARSPAQCALTAEAGMWWHSVSLSASRGWIQAGHSLLVNFFSSLLATFAFWVVQPAGFSQKLIQIVVDRLQNHEQFPVPTLQLLDLEVGEVGMILVGD